MNSAAYETRRGKIEEYFDRTAVKAWEQLTSTAPVGRIRATVRAGRERMRAQLMDWLPQDLHGVRILDAGCGTGRVGAELARRGHVVVGVDSDALMLGEAPAVPGARWVLGDLDAVEDVAAYDLVVAAGNVVVFLAEGTGPSVVARLARSLRPGGLLVSGWRTERAQDDELPVLAAHAYDAWCDAAGLLPTARHRGWAGEPWSDDADWCVAVHRRP